MVVALGADLQVLVYLFFIDNLPAAIALYPQPFRDLDLLVRSYALAFFEPRPNKLLPYLLRTDEQSAVNAGVPAALLYSIRPVVVTVIASAYAITVK